MFAYATSGVYYRLQKGRKGFETYLKNGCWENETEFTETGYDRATNGAVDDLYWFIDEQGASVRKVPKNASKKLSLQ